MTNSDLQIKRSNNFLFVLKLLFNVVIFKVEDSPSLRNLVLSSSEVAHLYALGSWSL